MKLKTAVVATSMLFAFGADAGPFGINPGDPIRTEGKDNHGWIYEEMKIENTGGFDSIRKFGVSGVGTCAVVAYTTIYDENAGLSVKDFFHGVKDILTEKYGSHTAKKDSLQAGSPFLNDSDWMASLAHGHRVLSYTWKLSSPQDSITRIILGIPEASHFSGEVRLQYDFDNVAQCREARKQVF